MFLNYLPEGTLAYDIEPEDERVNKQDYLSLDLQYKKGRCVIGNPPFGNRNTLSVKFFKKSLKFADYIAFILPISQLNNNQQMYEFDLIYSEDLGTKNYSGRQLHCCLNIFKRNVNGLNKKLVYKSQDIEIQENRRTGHQINDIRDFDIGICSFGKGIIGRIPEYKGQYAKEMYFKIHNDNLKDKIINIVKNTDWENGMCNGTSGQTNLTQWQVYKYIKEQIPEIN